MSKPLSPEDIEAFHREVDEIRDRRVAMIAAGYGEYSMPDPERQFRPDRTQQRLKELEEGEDFILRAGDREHDRILAEERGSADKGSERDRDREGKPDKKRGKRRVQRAAPPGPKSRWTFD